jgi:hypothetical protein
MCMIQGTPEKISDTRILVSIVNTEYPLQLVVYSNKVKTETPVAMILPFPNHSKKNFVKVLETTKKDNQIFDMLNISFIPLVFNLSVRKTKGKLEVLRSGSYRYSIVKSLSDFDSLSDIFKLTDPKLQVVLSKNYQNFGFIVCIIDANTDYTPFAYITEKLPDGKMFIPTRHYHSKNQDTNPYKITNNLLGDLMDAGDWDHSIYILGGNSTDFSTGEKIKLEHTLLLPVDCSWQGYIKDKFKSNECIMLKIKGDHPNQDILAC